jgi:hypothetical protein
VSVDSDYFAYLCPIRTTLMSNFVFLVIKNAFQVAEFIKLGRM